MKRIIALTLCLALLLSACTTPNAEVKSSADTSPTPTATSETSLVLMPPSTNPDTNEDPGTTNTVEVPDHMTIPATEMSFAGLNDENLLRYVEDSVYSEVVTLLDSDMYFVENVSAVYISKEYLDELAYNSQANIYFGFSLAELEDYFEGTKYVFTLGEDGQTTVQAFEKYDDTYDKVVRNVAIGTGVILLCVTVSVVTGGVAPAVSVIFAASAKSATMFALSGGVFSGVATGVITGIQTKNFDEALKAAALAGSEGFMWGAMTGAVTGGVGKYSALKGATQSGLTINEAAAIQQESKLPLDIIKQFKSVDEYQIYKQAGLSTKMINGRIALVRDIDLNYVSEVAGKKVTNLERMALGYAPIDPVTEKAYQLHHIGQKVDATLAVLTEAEHQGNSAILNIIGKNSEIDRAAFIKTREAFWKSFAASVS